MTTIPTNPDLVCALLPRGTVVQINDVPVQLVRVTGVVVHRMNLPLLGNPPHEEFRPERESWPPPT